METFCRGDVLYGDVLSRRHFVRRRFVCAPMDTVLYLRAAAVLMSSANNYRIQRTTRVLLLALLPHPSCIVK
jgi:hypothetical protein